MAKKTFSRIAAVILTLAIFASMLAPFGVFADTPEIWDGSIVSGFASGSGTKKDPYIIKTGAQLAYLAKTTSKGINYKDCYFKLGGDIVLNDTSNWEKWKTNAPKNQWNAISYFSGTFDGDGHTISGIYINTTEGSESLFGYAKNAVIQNLGVTMLYIKGEFYISGVVGYAEGCTISNCYNTGMVNGTNECVGGVVGYAEGCTISNCYNTGAVSGISAVGGVVGLNNGTVEDCYNTGVVDGEKNVGGVVGYNVGHYRFGEENDFDAMVENCYNTGAVSGSSSIGGVAGGNYDSMLVDCHNTGAISGGSSVGGVVGFSDGMVENCYNTGAVSGTSSIGGLIGMNRESIIMNCYYLIGCAKDGRKTIQNGVGNEERGKVTEDFGEIKGLNEEEMKEHESNEAERLKKKAEKEKNPDFALLIPIAVGVILLAVVVVAVVLIVKKKKIALQVDETPQVETQDRQ